MRKLFRLISRACYHVINSFFLFLIKFYQKYISIALPKSCRFHPSCSEYAKQAFSKYNFIKAAFLSFYRILRCNPFSRGGYDPLK